MAGTIGGDHDHVQRVLVEDEFFIAMDLRSLLIEGGYSVLAPAGTVAGALEMLEAEETDGRFI